VFSKSSSATLQCTQCASGAYQNVKPPKVLHRRFRHAKKTTHKIQDILQEVIVPTDQFKLTPLEINSEIVVFDSGDNTTLPIKPPDGSLWRAISVKLLHVEDET
jgi:hypothetical protein